jgi:hypothetical protein
MDTDGQYWAHVKAVVDAAPPLTPEQLQCITAITGLVPIDAASPRRSRKKFSRTPELSR